LDNNKQLILTEDDEKERLDKIFKSSRKPLILVKKNNDFIMSIIKKLLADTFS